MKKRYKTVLPCLAIFCLLSGNLQAQYGDNEPKTVIESKLTDRDGNPISGARVYANEGAYWAVTDETGTFRLTVSGLTEILAEAPGYESKVFSSDERVFTLERMDFLFGSRDRVNVAFGKNYRGSIPNAVSVLRPDDIRGYDNTQTVTSMMYGRMPGLYGASNLRGMGSVLFVVDGLPRDPQFFDISEIEEITFLKDVNASVLYGNEAANGVVLITTKRGEAHKKTINVSAYYGLDEPRALPNYLSSADYMEQYNLARQNDGLSPMYDENTIRNYREGNPYRYPDVDYYSGDYLKKLRTNARVMMDVSGGNDVATYYSHLSWQNTGSLLNFGSGKHAHVNSFSARGNVDLKVSRIIKTSVDAVGYIRHDKRPNVDFWGQAATLRPDAYAPLIPINLIDPELSLLKGHKRDIDGRFLLGGNTSNQANPIAGIYMGGDNTTVTRNFSFNNRIDVDLRDITDGLAFHTNISFDYLNVYDQYISNSYSVYEAVWHPTEDRIIDLVKYGDDHRSGTQNVNNIWGQRRFGAYAMLDYSYVFDGVHHVEANVLAYTSHNKLTHRKQTIKNTNMGVRAAYNYDNRYLVDFSGSIVNSVKLYKGNRTGFSPSLALGWIVSSEGFMSSARLVDFLKLKLSGGIMKTDYLFGAADSEYYLWDDYYIYDSGLSWYENKSRTGVRPSYGANKKLSFEKRQDINVGLEGIFLKKSISMELNFFKSFHSDIVTKATSIYPSYFANYAPYQNYNRNEYRGFEAGLSYNRSFGDISVLVGGTVLYADSKVGKKDEIFGYDYLYAKGHPVDGRLVLVADGFFQSQEEIDNHAVQSWGTVRPGDIRYVDQNNDGIIDDNDRVYASRWQAPWVYSLYLKLSYRNFTLFALGTGMAGATGFLGDYGSYYWAQGDSKYSTYMLNSWTEETKNTATYPRLSSQANDNNFRYSTFWLYKSNYFDFSRLQLTYDLHLTSMNKIYLKTVSVFCQLQNILTISKCKDVRTLNIGSEPAYRTYQLGLKLTF